MTKRDGTQYDKTAAGTKSGSGSGLDAAPNVGQTGLNGALDGAESVAETEPDRLSPADELIYIKEQLAQYKDAKLKLR